MTDTEWVIPVIDKPKPSRPFLNLGCGRTHLPGARPAHHAFVPEEIYAYDWVNVDRVGNVGADKVFDLFTYPWPLESDSYDGALLSHLCEHIPHEIKINTDDIDPGMDFMRMIGDIERDSEGRLKLKETSKFYRHNELMKLQDGWFAFFAELYRVLTPDARVHILAPHAGSDGAITDPTHTRYLTPMSFTHSMTPNPDAPFEYATGGIHFLIDAEPMYELTEWSQPIAHNHAMLWQAITTQRNMVSNFYIRLRAVKP